MDEKKDWNLELSEYIKQGEPNQVEKTKVWETAIGLQDVDWLKPSKYLIETAKEHIEGTINIEEVKERINKYYEEQNSSKGSEKENEEADKVAVRITEILSENAFNFSPTELLNIHKRLFTGIFNGAGIYRDYNFTKKEWVLNGDTVIYSSYETIKDTLEYDFEQERNFSYKDLSLEEKNQMIMQDKTYGELVCRCEQVTKGEILDSLSRSCPPHSIKALKKRLRVGFGKCQGGMCQSSALKILANYYHLSLN